MPMLLLKLDLKKKNHFKLHKINTTPVLKKKTVATKNGFNFKCFNYYIINISWVFVIALPYKLEAYILRTCLR